MHLLRRNRMLLASLDQYIAALLRIANATNGWFAQAGIREVAGFISSEPPTQNFYNFYIPGEMQPTHARTVADPSHLVRDGLIDVISKFPSLSIERHRFGVTSRTPRSD